MLQSELFVTNKNLRLLQYVKDNKKPNEAHIGIRYYIDVHLKINL